MADITGAYTFHGRGHHGLEIVAVSAAGALDAGFREPDGTLTPLFGTYNASTNQLVFNDAEFPGEVLFTTFFTGAAVVEEGEVAALAGQWNWQGLTIGPGQRPARFEHDQGVWCACDRQLIPG